MRNSTGLILSLLFGALSGCVSIPQFQITEQDKKVIPDQWSGSPALKATKAADLSEWWSTWSDPEIARLVAASQAANTDVRSAQENLRYAQASMTVANAGLFPTLDGNYRASRSHSLGHGSNAFSIGLNVSWTIDAGGRFAASEAAFSDYLSSQASLGDVQTRIAAEVARAYVNMRLAQKRLDVAQENAKTQQEALDIANWRYLSGLVPSTDVDQARTSFEQTRASIPVYRAQVMQYRNLIARLIGTTPEAVNPRGYA